MTDTDANDPQEDIILDALPDEVIASMESRDRWMTSLEYAEGGLEFLVADLQSFTPGSTVRVAFLGGSAELHTKIEEATKQITDTANLTLDFKNADGTFRTWTTTDTDYAAEIRVSFDRPGYFSLVGTDSINPNIGVAGDFVGGRPNQRSLNLNAFDQTVPATGVGTIRHEFLHALAFHHEHQNMRGPCEAAFRWEDDPGYQPTRDAQGRFVTDAAGRRPGIYTYLSGPPNSWPRAKVDHNLRTTENAALVAGGFDPGSVMLYRFPALFYKTQPTPCAPTGTGQELSDGDKRALELLYPAQAQALEAIGTRREALLNTIEGGAASGGPESGGFESAGGAPLSALAQHAAQGLRASLEGLRP